MTDVLDRLVVESSNPKEDAWRRAEEMERRYDMLTLDLKRIVEERNSLSDRLIAALQDNAKLRAAADRYEWLKEADPRTLCMIAWRVPEATEGVWANDPDQAIDKAMSK